MPRKSPTPPKQAGSESEFDSKPAARLIAERGFGLQTSVQYVKGIGPKRAEALAAAGFQTVRDLIYYFPRRYLDLSRVSSIAEAGKFANTEEWVNVVGTIRSADLMGHHPRQRFVMNIQDKSGVMQLVFFRSPKFFKDAYRLDEVIAVTGRVTAYRQRPQMVHPTIDRLSARDDEGEDTSLVPRKGLIAQYGTTEALRTVRLDSKGLRKIVRSALDSHLSEIEEFMPQAIRSTEKLIGLQEAIAQVHFPASQEEASSARERLKFDELFHLQLLLALKRSQVKVEIPGIAFKVESPLARKLVASLPFSFTGAQKKVLHEIAVDMSSPRPMNRLLQGDVGSGKTVVAVTSMMVAIENGYQAAFMAPTEILAEQHFHTISRLVEGLGINVRLLTGGQSKRLRRDLMDDISRGSANIVVGTHALIEGAIEYGNLGLVVIDEQHRFGVMQRAALRSRGPVIDGTQRLPDVLVMTATPIPRTLALTIYGDLDVSVVNEMPKDRIEIKTAIRTESKRESVYNFIRSEIKSGRQSYIVFPLVEESEKLDLRAATESYQHLASDVFPDLKVGLIHGRMAGLEKDGIMADFKSRKIDILVSTTVIEVGIDVPNASVMVIEHAERFGLSQLHQLRGRVGRGADQSYCILMAPDRMSRAAKKMADTIQPEEMEEEAKAERRLKTMVATTDGFKIAEIDLDLRGPGDFFGTRQSGLPELQIASLVSDADILARARTRAFDLVERDPRLTGSDVRLLREQFYYRMKEAIALADIS